MLCDVYSCINNTNGECNCPSYVTINKEGECDLLELSHVDLGLKTKDGDK